MHVIIYSPILILQIYKYIINELYSLFLKRKSEYNSLILLLLFPMELLYWIIYKYIVL